jgi:hypothetical protein
MAEQAFLANREGAGRAKLDREIRCLAARAYRDPIVVTPENDGSFDRVGGAGIDVDDVARPFIVDDHRLIAAKGWLLRALVEPPNPGRRRRADFRALRLALRV